MKKASFIRVRPEDLNYSLEICHQNYDDKLKMLKQPLAVNSSSVSKFIKSFPVHPTRESLEYALALLDTEQPKLRQRAIEIVNKVIELQNKNIDSDYCGTWPKYSEYRIPFFKGKFFKPDKNWTEFLSMILLIILVDHANKLNADLIVKIDRAILLAMSAIHSREVEVQYTNIFIKGAYVALIAGRRYHNSDLYKFGSERIQHIYEYTQKNGGFGEYNSPNYAIVTLKTLCYLLLHLQDVELEKKIKHLYRVAWQEIAFHFHSSTRQWAGPHSRTLTTMLKNSTMALINRATSTAVNLNTDDRELPLDAHRLPLKCPRDLEYFFSPIADPRSITQILNYADPPKVLSTYLTPSFTLGTINYSDLWVQRRSMIAYWQTNNSSHYLHLRFLCDGRDYSAAQFFSVQQEGNVLAGINFATDVNDDNPYLEKSQNEKYILAKFICIRFEFGNLENIKDVAIELSDLPGLSARVKDEKFYFNIAVHFAIFETHPIAWKVIRDRYNCQVCLDLVLFSARCQKRIDISKLSPKVIGLTFQMQTKLQSFPPVNIVNTNRVLKMKWNNLSLEVANRPDRQYKLQQAFRSST